MESNEQGTGLFLLKDLKAPEVEQFEIDDPLEDLLNEFSDFEDDDEGLSESTLTELEEFLASERQLSDNQKMVIEDQIKTLKEIYDRIRYYMDEVTTHFSG